MSDLNGRFYHLDNQLILWELLMLSNQALKLLIAQHLSIYLHITNAI